MELNKVKEKCSNKNNKRYLSRTIIKMRMIFLLNKEIKLRNN